MAEKINIIKCPKCGTIIGPNENLRQNIETDHNWALPINIGDPKKTIYSILGNPTGGMDGIDWFTNSGMSIGYDSFDNVSFIHLQGPVHKKEVIPYLTEVIYGLKISDMLDRFIEVLGESTSTNKPDCNKSSKKYSWYKRPYVITADFWTKDITIDGQTGEAGSLRYLQIEKM